MYYAYVFANTLEMSARKDNTTFKITESGIHEFLKDQILINGLNATLQ
tara:strand:+ start:90309 stop:90452 length:144 start_codon:yes stop_codon:yes gene_type:complete